MSERIFVDTNAFFKARRILEELIRGGARLVTSTVVIYEFIKIIDELIAETEDRSKKALYVKLRERFPRLLRELKFEILSHSLTHERLEELYRVMREKHVDVGDAMIYLLMRERGIKKILTYDEDWLRLDVEVLRPSGSV